MSEARELLGKIVALRQRLEQVQGLAKEASTAAVSMMQKHGTGLAQLWTLNRKVAESHEHDRDVDEALRPVLADGADDDVKLPTQLTARARRALQHGRDLLKTLRDFEQDPSVQGNDNPVARYYKHTVTMTDTTLRMAKLLPDAVSGQLHVCDGMEVVLHEVDHRLGKLRKLITRHHARRERIKNLAQWLQALADGKSIDAKPFSELAEVLHTEAMQCAPLQIHHPTIVESPNVDWVADCVARHSLVVAQVIARVGRYDADLKERMIEVIVAALLHDVGMLRIAPELIASREPLDANGRRVIEEHAQHGAYLMQRLLPDADWLIQAVRGHHERMQGAGYPDGLRESQLSPLARLLAVCDVYSACCASRPHRAAHDTRSALTMTLMLAEKGALDRSHAERLLHLSFYPIGMVVELADGSIGAVIATPNAWDNLQAPARPVVALLTDETGTCLPTPQHVDLAQCEARSIVRALPVDESLRVLGDRYPEWL